MAVPDVTPLEATDSGLGRCSTVEQVKAPTASGLSIGHDDDVPGDERVRAYYGLFKSLAEVYLEDSWVLEVDERGGSLVFDLEVVLTERHAFYGPPQPGEMHCYRRGQLIVRSPLPISLRRSGTRRRGRPCGPLPAILASVTSHSARRVLAVKPQGPWLVVVNGAWCVESPAGATDAPWETSRVWLLPLLERPRTEVESEGRKALSPGDPDLAEALRAIVDMGLTAWSDYWISRALKWIADDEAERFGEHLHKIALDRRWSQASQHLAKRLLKRHGIWSPGHHRLT